MRSLRDRPPEFKVVFLGTVAVGKTSLLHRFNTDQFATDLYATSGQTYVKKAVQVGITEAVLQLWDTPGQEQFAAESTLLLRNAHCCVVCYDLHNPATYECVATMIRRFDSACMVDGRFVVVVGNKSDLIPPDQQDAELERLAEAQKAHALWAQSFLTSARLGESVKELFGFIAARLIEQPAVTVAVATNVVNLGGAKGAKKSGGGCC
jgi:Ras-related protein Rab-5C